LTLGLLDLNPCQAQGPGPLQGLTGDLPGQQAQLGARLGIEIIGDTALRPTLPGQPQGQRQTRLIFAVTVISLPGIALGQGTNRRIATEQRPRLLTITLTGIAARLMQRVVRVAHQGRLHRLGDGLGSYRRYRQDGGNE